MAADRRIDRALALRRSLEAGVRARIGPVLERWWNNPLLRHARRQHGFPVSLVRPAIAMFGVMGSALAVIAWIARWRGAAAILFGLSLGAVMFPVLIAAPQSADRVARQMRFSQQDPRRLSNLDPEEIAWGLALATLWRLRWLIAVGLALTPALVVSVLHNTLAEYQTWQQAAAVMGDSVAAPHADMLRPDGSIPVFRLVVRAVSAGLTPWAALPLAAALGVWTALALEDPTLSPLGAALIAAVGLVLVGGLWNWITMTPLLAGGLEIVRVLIVVGLCAGQIAITWLVNGYNAKRLVLARSEETVDSES